MAGKDENQTMLFILSGIQASIKAVDDKIDDRWDNALNQLSSQKEKLDRLDKDMDHINKVVNIGNGKPSLVTQVFRLQKDMDEVKETSRTTLTEIGSLKSMFNTPKEVRVERWKTAGLFVVFLTSIASGLISLLL